MISSRQNPWFQRVRDAIDEHGDEIVIEGPKMVHDALAGGWKAIAVITRGEVAVSTDARHVAFTASLFDALRETKNSQGVLGLFERPRATLGAIVERRDTIAVALDGVQDPGNVGTIVRLAAAFDASGVILLPGSADAFAPKSIRASAGAILTVPIVSATYRQLLDVDFPRFAADGAATPSDPPTRGAVLIFGNEGAGVSAELLAESTPIAVATSGRVESLNVAASAAILLSRSFFLR